MRLTPNEILLLVGLLEALLVGAGVKQYRDKERLRALPPPAAQAAPADPAQE